MDIKPDSHLTGIHAIIEEIQLTRRECAQAREAFTRSVKAYKAYIDECRAYLKTAHTVNIPANDQVEENKQKR